MTDATERAYLGLCGDSLSSDPLPPAVTDQLCKEAEEVEPEEPWKEAKGDPGAGK